MARIAFVLDVVYPWVKGGVEITFRLLMSEMAKENEVYCFCLQFEGMKKEFVRGGVHYITVAKASSAELYAKDGTRSIGLARRFAMALPKAIEPYRFDIVYTGSFPYMHLGVLKSYHKKHRCKLIFDVSEVWDAKYWKDYLGLVKGSAAYHYAKKALIGADAYVATSSTASAALVRIGVPNERIIVFTPVIDPRIFKPASRPKRQNTVIYSGRLIKEKRLDLWIDAVAKAHKLNTKIKGLIVGSGPEETVIKKMTNRYPFIKMRKPYSSKTQLYNALGKSMAMLNMSEREGLSVITIESAALGTAPLLPSYTPIPEEVKELSIVRDVEDIPNTIADIASGRIKYRADMKKLERFDVKRTNVVFERLLEL